MRYSNRWALALLMICVVTALSCGKEEKQKQRQKPTGSRSRAKQEKPKMMTLTCPEFGHEAMIPSPYTADGDDVNPPLGIGEIPDGAKSLVLIMDDPDAPAGTWIHWVVYDIPITTWIDSDTVPGTQGTNSFGRLKYGGPAPPSGTHRYFFKLYALDTKLGLPEGKTKADIEAAMQGHVLGKAELIGLYKRK